MQNEDINTFTGRRVMDAPSVIAKTNQDDALTSMMHEIQTSRMSQSNSDSTMQLPGNAISSGKCSEDIAPGWDVNQYGKPKCGALPELDIEAGGSGETICKLDNPKNAIKPEFADKAPYGFNPYKDKNSSFYQPKSDSTALGGKLAGKDIGGLNGMRQRVPRELERETISL